MDVSSFEQAVSVLKGGLAAVFPTDTVYGLGVSVCHASGPDLIYSIKQRDFGKPVAWLVGGAQCLDTYAERIPSYAYALASAFWPGPLTLIVPCGSSVPRAFSSESGTIGLRMPASPTVLALIDRLGCPIATSSANISGRPAWCDFDKLDPELLGRVNAVLRDQDDSGKSGIASTVVDCTGSAPLVVREGSISEAQVFLHL